jgi:hypothetical protein
MRDCKTADAAIPPPQAGHPPLGPLDAGLPKGARLDVSQLRAVARSGQGVPALAAPPGPLGWRRTKRRWQGTAGCGTS